jgi:hypothetical protein
MQQHFALQVRDGRVSKQQLLGGQAALQRLRRIDPAAEKGDLKAEASASGVLRVARQVPPLGACLVVGAVVAGEAQRAWCQRAAWDVRGCLRHGGQQQQATRAQQPLAAVAS